MADFKYEILDNVGVIFNSKNGWTKEINIISWNGAEGKVDIRSWSPDHSRMGKGISLTVEEFKALKELMDEINPDDL